MNQTILGAIDVDELPQILLSMGDQILKRDRKHKLLWDIAGNELVEFSGKLAIKLKEARKTMPRERVRL